MCVGEDNEPYDGSHSSQTMRLSPKSKVISDPRKNFGGAGVDSKGSLSFSIPILVPSIQNINHQDADNEPCMCIS